MDIKQFITTEDTSIYDTVRIIDQNGRGILFICEEEKLLAVVSDGDIRRYILENGNMELPVKEMANYNPKYIKNGERLKIDKYIKEQGITALPVVDENGKIVELHFANGFSVMRNDNLGIPVVIMAGGKGTRLYPYTQILPKPLIPIGDKTITEHIFDRFDRFGCSDFKMIVNYKKHFIETYFQDSENPYHVEFLEEEEYLGTGGGLRLLLPHIKGTFFLSNCDILLEEDYGSILTLHKKSHNIITMVCAEKKFQIPYGTVEVSEGGQAHILHEKPEFEFLTNTGFYVIEPEFLERIPENQFIHITDVIKQCIDEKEKVGVYQVEDAAWLDMGQMDELEKMQEKLKLGGERN